VHHLCKAARRRFVRRLYIPLPEKKSRVTLLKHLLSQNPSLVTDEELEQVHFCFVFLAQRLLTRPFLYLFSLFAPQLGDLTQGYSGADVTNLAREAAMGPLRQVMRGGDKKREKISTETLRAISRQDFTIALKSVKPSVSNVDLGMYEEWNAQFGTQQFREE